MKKAKNGTRFSNFLLDGFFFAGILWGIYLLLVLLDLPFLIEENDLGIIIYCIAQVAYYYFFESVLDRTPAKFITTTKVVNMDGSKPNNKQILIRSLSRLIPFEPFSFLFGGTGWHDKFSDTMVVDV